LLSTAVRELSKHNGDEDGSVDRNNDIMRHGQHRTATAAANILRMARRFTEFMALASSLGMYNVPLREPLRCTIESTNNVLRLETNMIVCSEICHTLYFSRV
jgi:hypothetical protein